MIKSIIMLCIIVALTLTTCGCLGYFEGYTEKAQTYTSADYSISHYKFFIDTYNAIRQMGAQIKNAEVEMTDYKMMHPSPESWTRTVTNGYEELRFIRNGYIQQYNLFIQNYNSRMRDLTTNQMWMKPQNFPSQLDLYSPSSYITLNNPELSSK